MPLVIAVCLIAAQTLVALHNVAHANNNAFAKPAELMAFQVEASIVSMPSPSLGAQNKFWIALFGHALDKTNNTSACAAWDAAFAGAGTLDSHTQPPVPVFYNVASPPPVISLPVSTDLLGIALARAPPQA